MTPNGPQEPARRGVPTASELLQALSTEDHRRLKGLARALLSRAGATPQAGRYLSQTAPEDLVDKVFSKVLSGEHDRRRGRRLQQRNRASMKAFVACLRGLISDEVKTLARHAEAAFPHLPIGDEAEPGMVDPPDQADLFRLLIHRDLREKVFARLYQQATHEPELLPLIDLWRESFLTDDRVPVLEGDYKLTDRLRSLARKFIAELDREPGLGLDGRELL
jgi:hypothetical protein